MQKKVPTRMCVGCRTMKPKRELVRVVCNKDGEIAVDPTGKAAGRGAYVCLSAGCLERAVKSRALERAFSKKVEQDVFDALRVRIEELSAAAKNEDNEKSEGEGAK